MEKLKLKVPPPIVMLLVATMMWLTSIKSKGFLVPHELQLVIIISICSLATIVIFFSILSFKRFKTTIHPMNPKESKKLITEGMFSYSRNPIYLGMLIFLMAWVFYLSNLYSFTFLIIFILYMNVFQIVPEEEALELNFGVEFIKYKKKVRRWV